MKIFLKVTLPILVSVFCIFYVIAGFVEPAPKKEITIATGSKTGNYYKIALEYQKLLKEQNVKLNIINTSGSIENLKLLKEGKADIGFVQSGIIPSSSNTNLASLASIYYEPLWIFYKNQGYSINYVIELIGKKVAVGIEGSGTIHLSTQILNDNGITKDNTSFVYLSTKEAKKQLFEGKIDAIFTVISPNSNDIKDLLGEPSVELLSLKRVKAYNQKYKFLSSLTLYEGTIDMYKNLPSENKRILATTANLISTNELNYELVRLFLKQVKKVHNVQSIFEDENQFPSLNNLDTFVHEEARKYLTKGDSWLESIFPFWIASNIDRLKILLIPLLTLLFPLFKAVMPLYQWTMRSKIYKWYEKVDELNKNSLSTKEEIQENIKNLYKLKNEIQDHTKVPLAYKGEYYNLLLHIDLVVSELRLQVKEK